MFVRAYRLDICKYNFLLQDMLRFTVVDDYMEETDEDVDEEEEEEEEEKI
jgi:hypothetical protein